MYDARLRESLPQVRERIGRTLERTGRRNTVRIIAVTKGHPLAAVQAAVAAGLHECGENRVQELEDKVAELGRSFARWHLIGHLQRNKSEKAIDLSDLIHSIDSLRLAKQLSKDAQQAGVVVRGLVQVNASGEETKGGIHVVDEKETAAGVEAVHAITELPNLEIQGLMTMAPFVDDTAILHGTFARTRALLDACSAQVPRMAGRELSMGMSNDFEIAIEEGSTMVRLGTILFGERTQ